MSWLRAVGLACGAAALAVGCVRPGGGGTPRQESLTLHLRNGARTAVRLGIDRNPFTGAEGGSGSISDLTPLLQPGEEFDLPLALVTVPFRFDAYAIVAETDDLRGPFPCEVALVCMGAAAVPVIWTGSDVVCASQNRPIVSLKNESDTTVYLLVGDEQPALPLLPLAPGEARDTQLGENTVGGVMVRAVRFDAILGQTLVAFTQCPLVGSCVSIESVFDGSALTCGASP